MGKSLRCQYYKCEVMTGRLEINASNQCNETSTRTWFGPIVVCSSQCRPLFSSSSERMARSKGKCRCPTQASQVGAQEPLNSVARSMGG